VSSITAIDASGSGSPADPSDDDQVQEAFEQGLLNFMLTLLQSAQSDITSAINDTTSDPDDPGG
jgi:hypothetical protein